MTPIAIPVAKQPAMDLYTEHAPAHEKHEHLHAHDHDDASQWSAHPAPAHAHKHCHNGRLRRVLVPALLTLLALSALFAVSHCVFGNTDPGEVLEGLLHLKRAVVDGDGSNSTGSGSTFTKNKLYLIVVFVGLFVVVILAVMLSAWCCKGAFENPLCCPCYLCACCGGLACLECIGCGLCAEGVDQM
ncbi:hypothetical protein C8R46DRAFT_288123 [Mycena filopes]|nr:hypothetical protein C8R46DRAFT_288123 [Mycena filopes]